VAAPADPRADPEPVLVEFLPQLTVRRGEVVLARVEPAARRGPPGRPGLVVGEADQQRPAGGVDHQAAHGLPDRRNGDVQRHLHGQRARLPVRQPGDLAGRRHQRGQSGEVLVLGRPRLGGHGDPHPQPPGVADRVADEPAADPPGVPVPPARLVAAAPVEPGAQQNSTSDPPPEATSVQGKSTPRSAHRVTPKRTAPSPNA
jgi:hypothetical protein